MAIVWQTACQAGAKPCIQSPTQKEERETHTGNSALIMEYASS
jgi:hypothetical protein